MTADLCGKALWVVAKSRKVLYKYSPLTIYKQHNWYPIVPVNIEGKKIR